MEIKKEKISTINTRSIHFQEILERVPLWIIRWGNSIFLIIFSILLLGLYLIRYPDVIVSEARITSDNPSVEVVSQIDGKIIQFLKKDKEPVKTNDWIFIIENPANYNDILVLDSIITSLKSNEFWSLIDTIKLPSNFQLGNVGVKYDIFNRNIGEYKLFQEINPQISQISINKKRQLDVREIIKSIDKQKKLLEKEISLYENDLKRNIELFKKGVISKVEIERKEIEFISIQKTYEELNRSRLNAYIQKENIQKENTSLSTERFNKYFDLRNNILNCYNELLVSYESWSQNYVVKSPKDGILNLYEIRNKNQYLLKNEKVFTISPAHKQQYFALVKAPIASSGKIKVGQKVLIKLHNFPNTEFGALTGEVSSITDVPKKGFYLLKVDLPNQLKTTYEKILEDKFELTGIAEVITEDLSLFERMFNILRNLNN